MHPLGFEPRPPKGSELESDALDRSAMDANFNININIICLRWDSNPRIRR